MVAAVEKVELQPVSLMVFASSKTVDALRGIAGSKTDGYGDNSRKIDRSNGEAFSSAVRDIVGCEQFCKERNIPVDGTALELVQQAARELRISPEFSSSLLDGLNPEQQMPALMYAKDEAAVWLRLKNAAVEVYEALCPPSTKQLNKIEEERIAKRIANAQQKPFESRFTPAPGNKDTQRAIAFRDSLTASLLRRWRTAVEVATPFDGDKLGRIDDFLGKFSRHGYNVDDRALREVGGLTADMASRLLRVEELLKEDLAKVEPFLVSRLGRQLDGSTTEVALEDFGLVVRGISPDSFHVYHQDSDSRLFQVEGGMILENVLPAVVVVMLVRD